ncbi:hypothetical protein B0H21DRAFT_349594 [Amylocystis lapponica]|nr:hypothetical protein B0H21DRAFT_349594 [Amylocystis lapponica]
MDCGDGWARTHPKHVEGSPVLPRGPQMAAPALHFFLAYLSSSSPLYQFSSYLSPQSHPRRAVGMFFSIFSLFAGPRLLWLETFTTRAGAELLISRSASMPFSPDSHCASLSARLGLARQEHGLTQFCYGSSPSTLPFLSYHMYFSARQLCMSRPNNA